MIFNSKFKIKNSKLNDGFTLLELVVVFSIIGVLTALGFSSFTAYSRRQVVDQAATQVQNAVEEARFNALSKVKPTICNPDFPISGYEFKLCEEDDATCTGSYMVQPLCTLNPSALPYTLTGTLPSSVNVALSSEDCRTISYNILTGYTGENCEIIVSAYSSARKISVDTVGAVLLENTSLPTP